MKQIFDNLNKNQEACVLHTEGQLRIIAGAGAGKTRVLTRKVAYLIRDMGLAPQNILAVTFTNKAANEMKLRIINIIGDIANESNISTFHSLAVKILRQDIQHLDLPNDFKIIDTIDQKQILSFVYKKLGLNARDVPHNQSLEYISTMKINKIDIEDAKKNYKNDSEKLFSQVYGLYENRVREIKALDFDDLLIYTEKLLESSKKVREKWANKFEYILVDEFQDTSLIQYNIIKYLSSFHKNITIVGDPDQTIYSWRGADVSIILKFHEDFKKAKTVVLEENYRSTKKILKLSNKLIKKNKNRYKKELFTQNEDGEDVSYYHGTTPVTESKWIVNEIQKLRRNKVQLKNIAILYRANYLSKYIEQELMQKEVEYRVFGSLKFYQRSEIKDAIAFLTVIHNSDETALLRIINKPSRSIGDATVAKLRKSASDVDLPLFKHIIKNFNSLPIGNKQKEELRKLFSYFKTCRSGMKKFPMSKVLQEFLKYTGYIQQLIDTNQMDKIQNLNSLFKGMKDFGEKNKENTIDKYLKNIALWSLEDKIYKVKDFVSLMTIHAAKGLEFDNIFILGMSEGVFPSSRALDDKEKLEEERRLAYVALTRAKKKLFLTDSKGYSQDFETMKKPSRFFKEMGIDVKKLSGIYVQTGDYKDNYSDEKYTISVGDKIRHINFGVGEVIVVNHRTIDVKFKGTTSIKTLMKNHKAIEVVR
ncbi:MAG: UvrD-helicase domain-containing protein [Mycoplasma sp.]|nr:UvrD-helicase domain-containing protein [Mycoplasma sp.]